MLLFYSTNTLKSKLAKAIYIQTHVLTIATNILNISYTLHLRNEGNLLPNKKSFVSPSMSSRTPEVKKTQEWKNLLLQC